MDIMRWIYYYCCWMIMTWGFKNVLEESSNIIFVIPALIGCAAMMYCIVQYVKEDRELTYLQEFIDDLSTKGKQ